MGHTVHNKDDALALGVAFWLCYIGSEAIDLLFATCGSAGVHLALNRVSNECVTAAAVGFVVPLRQQEDIPTPVDMVTDGSVAW